MSKRLSKRRLLLAALLLLACGQLGPAPQDGENWTPVETSSAVEATAVMVAATVAASAGDSAVDAGALTLRDAPAGNACFGSGEGLSCLEAAGSWQRFTPDDLLLAERFIHAMARCPDGTLLAADSDQIYRYDGAAWSAVGDDWNGSSPDDLACATDGTIWVAYFGGLSRYAGGWTAYDAAALAPTADATDLVVAADVAVNGQVWVATAASVATLVDGSWRVFGEGSGFTKRLFINDLVVAPDGTVWVAHSSGLARWDGAAWQQIDAPSGSGSLQAIAAGPDGHIWAGSNSNGVHVYLDGSWASFNAADGTLPSNRVRDVAVDEQGRLWVGTAYGLAVYDGVSWQQYQMHTADLVDNALLTVGVTAGGPPLPAHSATAPGTLHGALRDRDGTTPLANLPVEICAAPIATFAIDDAPCAGQDFVRTTRSDDSGAFLFPDLPAGFYAVTFEAGPGEWGFYAGRFGFAERAAVPAGSDINLGDLVYDPDE